MGKVLNILASESAHPLQQLVISLTSRLIGSGVNICSYHYPDDQIYHNGAATLVVGSITPSSIHSIVTYPPKGPDASRITGPLYSGAKAIMIRSILPRINMNKSSMAAGQTTHRSISSYLSISDILDTYSACGVSVEKELAIAKEAFRHSAKLAALEAKRLKTSQITLMIKKSSKYQVINKLFEEIVTEVLQSDFSTGLSLDIQTTAKTMNSLIMFPEKLSVVLTNDNPTTEMVELAYAGLLGGMPRQLHKISEFPDSNEDDLSSFPAGHSIRSSLRALAQVFRSWDCESAARQVEIMALDHSTVESVMRNI